MTKICPVHQVDYSKPSRYEKPVNYRICKKCAKKLGMPEEEIKKIYAR
jgi:hypothetical protein